MKKSIIIIVLAVLTLNHAIAFPELIKAYESGTITVSQKKQMQEMQQTYSKKYDVPDDELHPSAKNNVAIQYLKKIFSFDLDSVELISDTKRKEYKKPKPRVYDLENAKKSVAHYTGLINAIESGNVTKQQYKAIKAKIESSIIACGGHPDVARLRGVYSSLCSKVNLAALNIIDQDATEIIAVDDTAPLELPEVVADQPKEIAVLTQKSKTWLYALGAILVGFVLSKIYFGLTKK